MSHQQNSSLFVVATPIGNLRDITIRALDVLRDVDVIVSESVTKTRNLLTHYGIRGKIMSYREANARRMIPHIIALLKEGKSVALVAEAGTPGISDPGRRLVHAARQSGFGVIPVPGASAVVAVLSVSGTDEARYVFEGFLPRKASRRRHRLGELASDPRQLVLFEAPHRLVKCLRDMREILGERRCLIAREVTKVHEEIWESSLSSLIETYEKVRPRGEFVIVCEGSRKAACPVPEEKLLEDARALIDRGIKKREAARMIAKEYRLKGSDVYKMIVRRLNTDNTGGVK